MQTTSDHSTSGSRPEKLRFDPTSPVVYEKWLRAQYAQAGINHGIHATIFLTGIRHVPAPPVTPEGYAEMHPNDPHALMFIRRINMYATEHEQARKIDQKLF